MRKLKYRKIEFAPQKRIAKVEDLVYDILYKVFGIKRALVTDMSSIYDFDFTLSTKKVVHQTDKALKKIKRIYGVDVFDVKGLLLYKIAERILEDFISVKTLCMMDKSMKNLAKGIVGKPVDLKKLSK